MSVIFLALYKLTIMKTMINNNANELVIEFSNIKEGALVYRAINHPLRQTIMHLLHKNGKMTVTQIYSELQLEQSVTSQHLAILRNKDLLVTQRNGKFVHYSINYERLDFIHRVTSVLLSKNESMECFDTGSLYQ